MSAQQMAPATQTPARSQALAAVVVGVIALAAAMAGILLRPVGNLSAFWPANAILLGLLVRYPRLAAPAGWATAALALVVADVATGSSWAKSCLLTFANLAGVGLGVALFKRLAPEDRWLASPSSLVSVTLIVLGASSLTSLFGAVTNVFLFHGAAARGFFIWLATELANYIVILPIVLTVPGPAELRRRLDAARRTPPPLRLAAPLVTFAASMALVPLVGGPGALAFPVPALLWCALTYGLAATSILTLGFAVWALVILTHATQGLDHLSGFDLISLRLGVMLVALAPITVASAMAERNALLRQATAARKAAEDAMAARTLLLATMAHELRSPLTSVVGFSSLMTGQRYGPLGHPKYIDYAQTIEMAGSHLSDLVRDLLDTARIEAGQFELALDQAPSLPIVEQSVRLVRGLAVDAGVALVVAPGPWPEVEADPRAIKQVLINLLTNAVKFSTPQTQVEVSAAVEGDRLVVRVRDQGRGIAEHELAALGRPFAQAGGEEAQHRGWGLGLALSRKLVAMHGGELRLESRLGAGTTAIFDLALV